MCVCIGFGVNTSLGGAVNSISFRPPKQGHVPMFSSCFLRSQTDFQPSLTLLYIFKKFCLAGIPDTSFAIIMGDSSPGLFTKLKEKLTRIVARHVIHIVKLIWVKSNAR